MNPIRPQVPGHTAPHTAAQPNVGRNAAQRAFFQQAMGQAAPAQAASAAPPQAQPVQRVPTALPAEPPQRILRPGSLLDIRI